MNPAIPGISLLNEFNNIWLEIGQLALKAIDSVTVSMNGLFEKTVDLVDEIRILQDEFGKLENLDLSNIGYGVDRFRKSINTPADYYTNAQNANVFQNALSASGNPSLSQHKIPGQEQVAMQDPSVLNEVLDNTKKYVKGFNNGVKIFEKFGGELPPLMNKVSKVSKGVGAFADIATADLTFAGVEDMILGATELVSPWLWVPALGIAAWKIFSDDREKEHNKIAGIGEEIYDPVAAIKEEKQSSVNFLSYADNPGTAIKKVNDNSSNFVPLYAMPLSPGEFYKSAISDKTQVIQPPSVYKLATTTAEDEKIEILKKDKNLSLAELNRDVAERAGRFKKLDEKWGTDIFTTEYARIVGEIKNEKKAKANEYKNTVLKQRKVNTQHSLQSTSRSITSGGPKKIDIHIAKFLDKIEMHVQHMEQGTAMTEEKFKQMFMRVLRSANALED